MHATGSLSDLGFGRRDLKTFLNGPLYLLLTNLKIGMQIENIWSF
jgi:hypothetical protein